MGVVSAIRLLPRSLGFAAKSGIISFKCSLCSRKTAQIDTLPFDTSGSSQNRATPLLATVDNTDHPHQPAEISHLAMTQLHLAIDMGQQRADRTAIDPGHVG